MKKGRLFLLLAALFLTACQVGYHGPAESSAGTEAVPADPVPEMRGVWVATVYNLNYPSRSGLGRDALAEEIDAILRDLEETGANAVFFQVRPASDALYESALFPYSAVLSGTQGVEPDGGFDPFAYLTEQAALRGIDVYAWVNPLRVTLGSKSRPQHDPGKLAEENPARRHPDWTVAYADGKL